ncbi:MAG TPA: glycosyltransferase [Holophagaceae bacterium]|nr:glycosyltransferase [Holophagaceae bacterium]
MDIVFLTDCVESGARGGAETQMLRIAETLHNRGWKVGVMTMLPSPGFREQVPEAEIPFVECASDMRPSALPMAFRMTRQLRDWKPSVLISFNYHADVMGRFCGRMAGVPAVVSTLRTVHMKTPGREWIYRLTEPFVTTTISNSQAGRDYMVSLKVLRADKTAVIPNGILTDSLPAPVSREEARAEFDLPPGAFLWMAVGNLRAAKDYPTLIAAAERCAAAFPEFHLRIAGGGEHYDELEADIRTRGLQDRVKLLGSRLDVPRLLRAADALVLSSAWEGMPNTVMEAMASGLPVVATDVGGVKELLLEGETGFIVPPKDPTALAERMLQLMPLPADRIQAMGQAGRTRILTHFDNERVVDRWEDTFRALIPDPPAHPTGIQPAFIVSLDFELLWGMRDKRSIKTYGDHILGEREAIPAMLALFRKYGIKASWASVGMTLFDRKEELLRYLPDQLPTYRRKALDPYSALAEIGDDERSDPYHFGLSLIRQIMDCEGQEIGSHTFSHFYCLEEGQTADQFKADLEASVAATERLTQRPRSFVFPRNQFNQAYLGVCSEAGFEVFRGNEDSWVYRESMEADRSLPRRGVRLLDNYLDLTGDHGFIPGFQGDIVNCPSSRFLRPYTASLAVAEGLRILRVRRAMTQAAREGRSFHLWWHPHNFGTHLAENLAGLESILRHHANLRERYGVIPMNMTDVGRMVRTARPHPWSHPRPAQPRQEPAR